MKALLAHHPQQQLVEKEAVSLAVRRGHEDITPEDIVQAVEIVESRVPVRQNQKWSGLLYTSGGLIAGISGSPVVGALFFGLLPNSYGQLLPFVLFFIVGLLLTYAGHLEDNE